jgi:hypothetical protein
VEKGVIHAEEQLKPGEVRDIRTGSLGRRRGQESANDGRRFEGSGEIFMWYVMHSSQSRTTEIASAISSSVLVDRA